LTTPIPTNSARQLILVLSYSYSRPIKPDEEAQNNGRTAILITGCSIGGLATENANQAVSIGIEVKFYAPDMQLARTRIPRIKKPSLSSLPSSKPYLLENQIAVLRLTAENLCLLKGAEAIDLRRRKTVDELLSSGRLTIDATFPQPPAMGRGAEPKAHATQYFQARLTC
jgi:hypothetical protein